MTVFTYDQRDRLTLVTENYLTTTCTGTDCNVQTQYQYDRADNRVRVIDGRGITIQQATYDAANQQRTWLDGLGRTTTFGYDALGRPTERQDPRGAANTVTYAYDGRDRLTTTTAPNLGTLTQGYDALGRRLALTDSTGTTSFGYDALGRPTSLTAPNTGSVSYAYDGRSQRTSLTYPGGGTAINYTYRPDGHLATVAQGGTTLAAYTYDTVGRLDMVTRANGVVSDYAYDGADRLTDLHHTSGGQTVSRFSYELDRLGQRRVVTETLGVDTGSGPTPTSTPAGPTSIPTNTPVGPTSTPLATATATATSTATSTPLTATATPTTGSSFYRAINLNGTALTLDGNAWEGKTTTNYSTVGGTFCNQNVTLSPATGTDRATMIRCSVWGNTAQVTLSAVPTGDYDVFLYVWEDNNSETYSIALEGQPVQANHVSGAAGTWSKLGPWPVTITGGTITVSTSGGAANLSGLEVWQQRGTATGGTITASTSGSGANLSGLEVWPQRGTAATATATNSATPTATATSTATAPTTTPATATPNATATTTVPSVTPTATTTPASAGSPVYTDTFATGWSRQAPAGWTASWSVSVSEVSSPTYAGTKAWSLSYQQWGGFQIMRATPLDVEPSRALSFALQGTGDLEVYLMYGSGSTTSLGTVTAPTSWATFRLNLPAAGLAGVTELVFKDTGGRATVVLDEILLVPALASGQSTGRAERGSGTGAAAGHAEQAYLPLVVAGAQAPDVADDAASVLGVTALDGATIRTITYAYDGLLRLTGATESTGTSYTYTYDRAGNRTDGGRSYDAANQVIGWSYDAAGNRLSDGSTTSTYDALGRLTSQAGTSYAYNGDGVLVAQTVGGTTTYYTQIQYGMSRGLSQIIQATQGGVTTDYIYGLDRLAAESGGTRTWYLGDALGSLRQTLDSTGTPLATANYDPWGVPQSSAIAPFGFTGELQDAQGLTYLRARWYTPDIGTFLSVDPFQGFPEQPYTQHAYAYAIGDPVRYTDTSGRCFTGVLIDTLICKTVVGGMILVAGGVVANDPAARSATEDIATETRGETEAGLPPATGSGTSGVPSPAIPPPGAAASGATRRGSSPDAQLGAPEIVAWRSTRDWPPDALRWSDKPRQTGLPGCATCATRALA